MRITNRRMAFLTGATIAAPGNESMHAIGVLDQANATASRPGTVRTDAGPSACIEATD